MIRQSGLSEDEFLAKVLESVSGNRGVAYDENGELDRANAAYTEGLRRDPGLAEAYINRGIAYDNQGEPLKAEVDFAKGRQLEREPR